MVEYSIEEIKKYLNGGVLRQREKLMGSTPSLTYKELGRYYCWYCQPNAFKQIDVILSAITQKQKDIEERKLKEDFLLLQIYTTLDNHPCCIKCYRKLTGKGKHLLNASHSWFFEDDKQVEYLDFIRAIEGVELTVKQKKILRLYMLEYTQEQIAEQLRVTQQTVKIYLDRIIKKIFKYLNKGVCKNGLKMSVNI